MTPSPDDSARILTELVLAKEPFIYARVGDGDIYCALAMPGYGTGEMVDVNGERSNLRLCWRVEYALRRLGLMHGRVYIGDFASRSSGLIGLGAEWEQVKAWLVGPDFLDLEALLFHRESDTLTEFYQAVAADTRSKVFLGPERLREGASLLRADFLEVPLSDANEHIDELAERLLRGHWEVAFLSAGRSSKPIMVGAADHKPERTYIDLGSALDPLFVGTTRSGQVSPKVARGLVGLPC